MASGRIVHAPPVLLRLAEEVEDQQPRLVQRVEHRLARIIHTRIAAPKSPPDWPSPLSHRSPVARREIDALGAATFVKGNRPPGNPAPAEQFRLRVIKCTRHLHEERIKRIEHVRPKESAPFALRMNLRGRIPFLKSDGTIP